MPERWLDYLEAHPPALVAVVAVLAAITVTLHLFDFWRLS